MKYKVKRTNKFSKDIKRCISRGLDENLLWKVVDMIATGEPLPAKYRPHKLHGKYKDFWECHIQWDWLLMWQQKETELILILTDTGSHSDLF
jgi:mRNA interferase YafQ